MTDAHHYSYDVCVVSSLARSDTTFISNVLIQRLETQLGYSLMVRFRDILVAGKVARESMSFHENRIHTPLFPWERLEPRITSNQGCGQKGVHGCERSPHTTRRVPLRETFFLCEKWRLQTLYYKREMAGDLSLL